MNLKDFHMWLEFIDQSLLADRWKVSGERLALAGIVDREVLPIRLES